MKCEHCKGTGMVPSGLSVYGVLVCGKCNGRGKTEQKKMKPRPIYQPIYEPIYRRVK